MNSPADRLSELADVVEAFLNGDGIGINDLTENDTALLQAAADVMDNLIKEKNAKCEAERFQCAHDTDEALTRLEQVPHE